MAPHDSLAQRRAVLERAEQLVGHTALETGEPIGPDEPIPEPIKWTSDMPDAAFA